MALAPILAPMRTKGTWGTILVTQSGYRAKKQTVYRRFQDKLSAQSWLAQEHALVEADRQGIQTWTHPTEREQAQAERGARSITVGDWLDQWGEKFIKETTTGAPTSAGTQRTRHVYLAHLHRAPFIDKPLRMLTAADVERWIADFDAGPTPRKNVFPDAQEGSSRCRSARLHRQVPDREPSGAGVAAVPASRNPAAHTGRACHHRRAYARRLRSHGVARRMLWPPYQRGVRLASRRLRSIPSAPARAAFPRRSHTRAQSPENHGKRGDSANPCRACPHAARACYRSSHGAGFSRASRRLSKAPIAPPLV